MKNYFSNSPKSETINFVQQSTDKQSSSRQAYIDKLQSKINSTAEERKKEREEAEAQKRAIKLKQLIEKQEAMKSGSHFSGPANTCDGSEEQKRKDLEELIKNKKNGEI